MRACIWRCACRTRTTHNSREAASQTNTPTATTDQFATFTLGDITELLRGDPQRTQHVVVDNHPSPTGQGPDGELFVPGRAELAHHERVERRTDRGGDLPGHRDAAARQTEHQHVRVPAVGVEQPGQDTAGLSTVPEHASW